MTVQEGEDLSQSSLGCSVCQSSDACPAEHTCYTGFEYLPVDQGKGFACSITSPALLVDLITKDSVLVECFAGTGGNCSFSFGMNEYPNRVSCEVLDCESGGTAISCNSISCDCQQDPGCSLGSPFVQAFVAGAVGKASFTCTPAGNSTSNQQDEGKGDCVLRIPEFLVPEIGVLCSTGQCLIPQSNISAGQNSSSSGDEIPPSLEYQGLKVNVVLNACIAAIPTIMLCCVSVFVYLFWLYRVSPFYASASVCGVVCSSRENNFPTLIPDSVLEFRDISARVLLSKRMMERRKQSLYKKYTTLSVGKKEGVDMENGMDEDVSKANIVIDFHTREKSNEWGILESCSGVVQSGMVVGVLGGSGSGKTTLLQAIAGTSDRSGSMKRIKYSGKVSWDGMPLQPDQMAFVPQMDAHIPTMTVLESIMFAAILKLQGTGPQDLIQKVQRVMNELGIDHIADQYVGGTASLKGVSGGERRRVTIGMAIVSDPAGIILDEPLSGLDSYNAFAVTDCLKSLAKKGRVVMFSLHQPSKEMYSTSLDQVIFMAHGRIMYQGSPDVHGLMGKLSIPMKTSYAESMLQAMNDPEICALMYREHCLCTSETPSLFENSSSKSLVAEQIGHSNNPSIWLQIAMTFNRTFKDILRNKSLLILHVSISIAAGLIMGGLFYQLTFDTDGVQGRFGGIFVSLCFLALTSLTIIDLLMNERTVVISEVLSGLYPGVVYLISKLTCDGLLLRALPALLYSIPFYFMAGFRYDAARFFSFAFVLMLFSMCIGALAMLVTLCSKTAGQSSFIMNTLLLFELSFTGFLINVNAITPVLQWIHWLSQFYYAFEAIIQTELNQGEYDLILSAPGLKPINLTDTAGEVFINTLGYQVDTSTRNIGILIAYYYGFALLCIAVFHVRTRTGILKLV